MPRPAPTRASRTLALLLLPVAVLVSAALVVWRLSNQPPAVPAYTLTIEGAAPGEDLVRRSGDVVELVLRPTNKVTGVGGARVFFVRADHETSPRSRNLRGEAFPLEGISPQVTPEGVLRIRTAIDERIPSGDWYLAVAVGRLEFIPQTPEGIVLALRNEHGTSEGGWHLLHRKIRIAEASASPNRAREP